MLPRRGMMGGPWRHPATKDGLTPENAITELEMPGENETPGRSNTGNAGRDGYTVYARRVRGDMPGEMVDVEEADRIEAAMGGEDDYPGY